MSKRNWMKSNLNWVERAGALFLMCAATAITLAAQTLTTLHSFHRSDGGYPQESLVQANDGNLYGTSWYGGANYDGTVFKITPSGTLTTVYSFCSQSGCTDGEEPEAALVQATDGNLYGTTAEGGANGGGTVFKITPSGALTTLYSFCSHSGCTEHGFSPGGLVQATDGNFYGTTYFGGAGIGGAGTVFKITPSGALTTLYSFCTLSNCPDGDLPYAAMVQANDGNLYGTTGDGGANGDAGTVFKITPSGALTTLYSFCSQSGCRDGELPGELSVQATDGNFYGTTYEGGANGPYYGTIFKITPSGTLTTLYSFCSQSNCTDGEKPGPAMVQDTNGNFYGTTYEGGANGYGTVFSLSVGLRPFVETQ
ncbi:MAG TPA: choice-of-anchor tandem repeat GloVer-containing protein, partial [Terriglobia bacterium]|nr:choice-of-anchor tandem repeat GloVer-containing protein [Terriglobia bacterium]